ncbi:MAG: ferritin-like domain-containing protein [Acidiferrobacteraceae bacterium]
MAKSAARELIEINGVDVDKLLDSLTRMATCELANYYYYSVLRLMLVGVEGDALRTIIEEARVEDHRHFEALMPRIYDLGGSLPDLSAVEFSSALSLNKLPRDASSIDEVLETLRDAADHYVREYSRICSMTCGKDNRTYSLALAILHEKIQHQVWFLEFIGHGPGEHFLKEGRTASPFVGRLLQGPPLGNGSHVSVV